MPYINIAFSIASPCNRMLYFNFKTLNHTVFNFYRLIPTFQHTVSKVNRILADTKLFRDVLELYEIHDNQQF